MSKLNEFARESAEWLVANDYECGEQGYELTYANAVAYPNDTWNYLYWLKDSEASAIADKYADMPELQENVWRFVPRDCAELCGFDVYSGNGIALRGFGVDEVDCIMHEPSFLEDWIYDEYTPNGYIVYRLTKNETMDICGIAEDILNQINEYQY